MIRFVVACCCFALPCFDAKDAGAAEQGFAGYEISSWQGVFAPAGTPPDIVKKLNVEIVRIIGLPDVQRRAEERAAVFADRLEQSGVHAEGRAGDGDPLLAIADALSTFPADQILIAALPGRSSQMAEELASRARARFALPALRAGESLLRAA